MKIIFKFHIPFIELSRENKFTSTNPIFSIGIYVGKDPFHLYGPKDTPNPVLTASDIRGIDAEFVADPFMIQTKDNWYMFFEVMNSGSGKGEIALASSKDCMKWEYRQIVLSEPFHLSYPCVFLAENSYFMIPETGKAKSIRLYKATDFPYSWKYEATLLSGLNFKDSTIFQYEGKWWIFSETSGTDGTLRLYYSDTLYGPWKEHPSSPVIDEDANIARSGGKVLFYQNKIFRITQDCWPTYGNKIRIFQINDLTSTTYSEHELCGYPELEDPSLRAGIKSPIWRYDGFHQLDLHQLNEDYWIACIDGVTRTSISNHLVLKLQIPFTTKKLYE